MPVELNPPQPQPVAAAISGLLAGPEPEIDPWWVAGLGEALRSGDGSPAEDPWGGAGVVEP
jgi:hypothetical protein